MLSKERVLFPENTGKVLVREISKTPPAGKEHTVERT
jgi:hypothetical protein